SYNLTSLGIGQSTVVGIGGDRIVGLTFAEVLEMFERDKQTDAIVLIGEIGGRDEERAAEFIKKNITKPVIGYIAGITAPPGKRMGHAGAIIEGGIGTAEAKIKALKSARVEVGKTPKEVADLVAKKLK
ncbi:MAG: succinate--CoA ligase subunit alpha, partial [Archaeoglobaceae archaeon]